MHKGLFSAAILTALFLPSGAMAQGNYVFVTNFSKNSNIQTNLIAQFPTGLWVATNSLETRFDIVANPSGENFYAASTPLSVALFVPAVTNVFTLMNAYAPGSGTVATVEFKGDGGADQKFTLQGGVNIRDFYQGQYVNSINNSTTENAYEIFNVQDAGGTGNVNTGLTGDYVIDEQIFALNSAFLTQNLTNIILSGDNNGTPIILGITAQSVAALISSVTLASGSLTIQAGGGISNATYLTLTSTNLALSLSQWTPVATNVLAADGNFSIMITNAINRAIAKQFFILETE